MNKKQLISMWCGIAVIFSVGLVCAGIGMGRGGLGYFFLWFIVTAAVTAGLIYTLKDTNKDDVGDILKSVKGLYQSKDKPSKDEPEE